MNDIAISLKNVSKYYKLYNAPKVRLKEALSPSGKTYHKKFYATKNLDLEVKKGEILGLVGKNGSGKSTLLKLITGVLIPDEGSVKINGKISALLELGSGFNPEFTGIQNIFFYGTILGFRKEEMAKKLDDIIAFADIGDFINQPLKTYSSGMKSRLGFAVAVHIDPEILILDEVLAVGDELFKRKCYAKMEDFFQGGKTIIYVSHDANSIKELCTRAIFLDAGNILLDSDPNTVTKYYQKYIFAKEEKKEELKKEILNLKILYNDSKEEYLEKKNATIENKSISPLKKINQLTSYFIPNFIPQNTVEYKIYDVDIHTPKIISENGEQVNVLVYGQTYSFEITYTSKENITFENVAFGIDIHTEQGVHITSIESVFSAKYGYTISKLDPFEAITVKYKFTCMLSAGNYYLNYGLSSYRNNEQQVINRKVDFFCFKVLDFDKRITGGQIYLFNKITLNHKTLWEKDNMKNLKGNLT